MWYFDLFFFPLDYIVTAPFTLFYKLRITLYPVSNAVQPNHSTDYVFSSTVTDIFSFEKLSLRTMPVTSCCRLNVSYDYPTWHFHIF